MLSVKQLLRVAFPGLVQARRIRRLTDREQEIKLLPLVCDPNKLSIDVGGNLGLYVHHLRGLSKSVVVFEPIPQLQTHLKRHYPDVRVEGVALSGAPGQAQLRMPVGNYSWATIAAANDLGLAASGGALTSIDVPVETLDSFGFSNVGVLKIDVEGHEEAVLRGAVQLLSREKPSIIVEVEERHNAGSIGRVSEFLKNLGYDGFYFYENRLVDIGEFNIERDQSTSNVDATIGKTGRYINNFIFVPAGGPSDRFRTQVSTRFAAS